MDGILETTKRSIAPGSTARKWLLSCLAVVLVCTADWLSCLSEAQASEPDLTLLKAVYADADFSHSLVSDSSPLTIPAAAFNVDSNNRKWFFGFNNAYIYPNGGTYCGIAPVYLPQGAVVTSFLSSVYDNDATQDIFISLYAKPLGSMDTATTMASTSTSAASTDLRLLFDTTIDQATINNNLYTYLIGVCLWGTDDNQRFYASRVNFVTKIYLPNIVR